MADSLRDRHVKRTLARLDELSGYKVAQGDPDVRGWDVVADDGRRLGEVKHLIADPAAMVIRYLEVELDPSVSAGGDRQTLIPIGAVRLDRARDRVILDALSAVDTVALPTYPGGANIPRDYENTLRDRFARGRSDAERPAGAAPTANAPRPDAGPAGARDGDTEDEDYYSGSLYDTGRFSQTREPSRPPDAPAAAARDGEARMTLAEEQLDISKRAVQAGEVGVRKVVETEHVTQRVPVVREEVTVERRPVSADSSQEVTVTDDEIRIPILEERLVVEKRVVPVEEIIIRKRAVTEERTVEADLRRERAHVDEDRLAAPGAPSAAKTPGAGTVPGAPDDRIQLDVGPDGIRRPRRVADVADDVKDRVDGDPRSVPGPDPTDRPERRA
jgi:uncharacterized protein (TIGR02271 family)